MRPAGRSLSFSANAQGTARHSNQEALGRSGRDFICQDEDDVSRLTMWQHDVEALKEASSCAGVAGRVLELDVPKPGSLEAPTAARPRGRSAAGSWEWDGPGTVSNPAPCLLFWPGSD